MLQFKNEATVDEWAQLVLHVARFGQDPERYITGDVTAGHFGGEAKTRPEGKEAEIRAALAARPRLIAYSGESAPAGWAVAFSETGANSLAIDIHDDIGSDGEGGVTSARISSQLRDKSNVSLIRISINSRGGDVEDGIAIYNRLVNHPARVEVQIEGLAASIASIIAMAGDDRSMGENARIMIHDPWSFGIGRSSELRKRADLLDTVRAQMADIYVARTGLGYDEVLAMMKAETWLTGREALAKGFVDRLTSNKSKEGLK